MAMILPDSEKLSNPQKTIEVIKKWNFAFNKRFGQNFLIDSHVLNKIIAGAEVGPDDVVLEIGPGIGTMTQYLAEAAGKVIAVEVDKNLLPILEETLAPYDNVEVIHADVLSLDLTRLVDEKAGGRPIKVVANLPYYITTPIIMGLFEQHVPLANMTVMVQKEVAARMKAGPGSKDYGALSLAVQYYAEPYIVANVPQNCFMPRPNVDSAVIRLTRFEEPPVEVKDEAISNDEKAVMNKEAERLLSRIDREDYVILIDLHGKPIDSLSLAKKIDTLFNTHSRLCFVIAGSLGFGEAVIKRADERIKLSDLTFLHQMTRLILLEQIYRSFKILNHETYHK